MLISEVPPSCYLLTMWQTTRDAQTTSRHSRVRILPADIKGANQKHRDERLNRSIQNFLYSMLQDDSEMAAKKSLAVLTELWRRHVWRDARTVNVIGASGTVQAWLLANRIFKSTFACPLQKSPAFGPSPLQGSPP